jgi:hypothetical protein
MRWSPTVLIAACVAAGVARAAAAWSRLPPVMASHFSAAGTPDGAMPRGAFFTTLAIACGAAVLLPALTPRLLRHVPAGAINIPHRDYWLAPERRVATIARLEYWLGWFPVPVAALFALIVELVVEANLHHTSLNAAALWTGLALFAGSLMLLIRQLYREFALPQGE